MQRTTQKIICCIIIGLACCRPNMSQSEADIYEFLNQVLEQTTPIDYKSICCVGDKALYAAPFTNEDSIELLKLDTLFTTEDIPFMREQARNIVDFRCNGKLIDGKSSISLDTLNSAKQMTESFWKQLHHRNGVDEFLTVVKPIFSKDKLKVIVSIDYYTSRGGGGETAIYRKENGRWKYAKIIRSWDN